jgi:deoxyribose-phosphate aldolase
MNITLDTKPTIVHSERVPILPFDLAPVEDAKVNRSDVERRAATIPTRRTVKKRTSSCLAVTGCPMH